MNTFWKPKKSKVTSVRQTYWKQKRVPIFRQRNDDGRLGGTRLSSLGIPPSEKPSLERLSPDMKAFIEKNPAAWATIEKRGWFTLMEPQKPVVTNPVPGVPKDGRPPIHVLPMPSVPNQSYPLKQPSQPSQPKAPSVPSTPEAPKFKPQPQPLPVTPQTPKFKPQPLPITPDTKYKVQPLTSSSQLPTRQIPTSPKGTHWETIVSAKGGVERKVRVLVDNSTGKYVPGPMK